MSSDAVTPDTLGPQIVGFVDWLIEGAEAAEGKAEQGPIIEDLCQHYRALAICLFADDGNTDDFFHWLLHSPLAHKHYLVNVQSKGLGKPAQARASFVDPVLDAIVAQQWELARELGELHAPDWLEGSEYEDDFCYGEFWRCALAQTSPAVVFERWRRTLEGGQDLRLDVAEAWSQADAQEFEQALRALLAANAAQARNLADPNAPSVLAENFTFAPNCWVAIEGLAFLALAERHGIAAQYELEGCPAAARTASYAPFRSRAYPHLELA